ncbi:MAG: zinc dependent phospholipase C family protein [Oligoflexia bacterium]|nr:zinc dependent phospholipase C family protein [Oligoflexia bacterium]
MKNSSLMTITIIPMTILTILTTLTTLLTISIEESHASGMLLHILMCKNAIEKTSSPEIQHLLRGEMDAYLSGCIFPDSGYAAKEGYGEYTHWTPFLNKYLDLLLTRCPITSINDNDHKCKKNWAHFFGNLAHALADMNFDRHFLPEAAIHDFNNDHAKAHKFLDLQLEFVAANDYKKSITLPDGYAPMPEIVETCKQAGIHTEENKIKQGICIMKLAYAGIRISSPFLFRIEKRNAPWTTSNYFSAKGGIDDTGNTIAQIFNQLSEYLFGSIAMNDLPFILSENGEWPWIVVTGSVAS